MTTTAAAMKARLAFCFAQNAHVCTVHADDPAIHGVQVLLKGGQVGAEDVYGLMLNEFDSTDWKTYEP